MGERGQWTVGDQATMVEEFLKFRCSFDPLVQEQVRLAAHIGRVEKSTKFDLGQRVTQFVGGCSLEKLDGFGRVVAIHFDGCTGGGQPVVDNYCVDRILLFQLVCHLLCSK